MTQVIAPFSSSTFRAARVLDDPRRRGRKPLTLSRDQIKRARHMTWDGATLAEIHDALGLDCCRITLWSHLKKLNIRTNRARRFERK